MFGTFMIAPCGATGKTKQGYFLSRGNALKQMGTELYAHSCNASSEGAEYNDTGGADGILILSNPFTFVRA